ncbi:MAG TPA: hypothetical protein VNZ66_11150, partial [Aeromicrobium sp.]|nr:hypothetical protein [Aeromicrobium sp.]
MGEPVGGGRTDWHRRYARRLLVSDIAVLLWVFSTAHLVWAVSQPENSEGHASAFGIGPITVSLVLLTIWLIALALAGTREPIVLGAGPDEYKRIVTSTLMWFGVVAFAGYVISFWVPRWYVVISVAFGLVLLLLSRWSWRRWLVMRRQNGAMSSRTIVVGTRGAVERIIGVIGPTSQFGYRLVGVCVPDEGSGSVMGLPVLGNLD